MFSTSVKSTSVRNILARRSLHMTSATRSEGATASSKGFGEKEKAVETKWAREHDAELLKKLRKSLEDQEKTTAEIKEKLAKLEGKQK
ncbi:hypothetical protein G6F57_000179 [Rhizopus arrhizus]|uniref:ATPase inhibitor, mitochondrial n=2 Tax=Rhizopus TaxID=4842 RepID=A0A9P6X283_RHIOR|nr:hypothetical protein G6F23_005748 [Rhizopus arrhizus]KAG1055323.1 hypothetical protein G6F43_002721 [Rhizopus delemar]KAG0760225.1 hypothetical protein G6F24_008479 [Rhizopus arrhizus]KAG0785067.1 hypothetical protein G6F22_008090 [Rhizopus arrhizus]KAG0787059.1 hypothetical protein G6F21_008165 [Rhizopus arrhizus]